MQSIACVLFLLISITTLINLTDVSDLDDYERGAFFSTERKVSRGR